MLLPLSWLIALATVVAALEIIAAERGTTLRQLLQTNSLWPLAVILPTMIFGKVLGLIALNCLVFITPLKKIFDRECAETERRGFMPATSGLIGYAAMFLVLSLLGSFLFVWLNP